MKTLQKINLKKEFLKMFVKEAPPEQLEYINSLFEQNDYEQINQITDEYIERIINNTDLKTFGEDEGSPFSGGMPKEFSCEDNFSTEDMDPHAFELYCILVLIDELLKEQDKWKKQLLINHIQIALNRYRNIQEYIPIRIIQ